MQARLHNNYLTIKSVKRKSWLCDPISEEPLRVDDFDLLKRHHRPRPPLPRTNSAPKLISTITTAPVRINRSVRRRAQRPPLTSSSPVNLSPAMSLMPEPASYSQRIRGASHIDFKTATTGVAAKAMRNEISRLVSTVEDPLTKKVCVSPLHPGLPDDALQAFDTEMQSFFFLFTRYLSERAKSVDLYAIFSLFPTLDPDIPEVTGTASSRPLQTRSYPMPTSLLQKIPPVSTNSPSSRSTAVSVHLWV